MQILDDFSALRSGWPAVFTAITGLLAAGYCFRLFFYSTDGGAVFDLACGIAGFCMIVFLAFYKLRKSVYRIRLGTMQSWMQAHINIGILCAVLVMMHVGFKMAGPFSLFLMALFLLVAFSGIVGAMIYNVIPVSVNKYARDTLPLTELEEKIAGYLNEADKSVEHTEEEFKSLYMKKIRPHFVHKGIRWTYLLAEERMLLKRQRDRFEKFKKIVPTQNVYDISVLALIAMEKEKLTFRWVKLRMLRGWLNFHMPLSFALIAAVITHMITIFYF
jgi:hypothetical protein